MAERTADLQASTLRLSQSEERYRSLVDYANDIVATLDLNGIITFVNPAVERLLGYKPDNLIGKPLRDLGPQEEMPTHEGMLQRKLAGEAATQYEMLLLNKDGQQRFALEVNSRLMFDGEGKPMGIHSSA